MCRLLGGSLAAGAAFHPEWLKTFARLADSGLVSEGSTPGHRDGWGLAGIVNGVPRMLGRHPGSMLQDAAGVQSALAAVARERPNPVIAHLRKASPGLGISPDNTHPFVIGNALFCHNGSIRHPERFPLTHPAVVHGTTDSERWFAFLMEQADHRTPDAFRGRLIAAIRRSREITEASSWTFLLACESTLYAYREARDGAYAPEDEPPGECLRTHTLMLATLPGTTLCCSEPIPLGARETTPWSAMQNRELVVLEAGRVVSRERV